MPPRQRSNGRRLLHATAFFTVTVSLAVAQTRVTPPKNKYTPAQDVEIGQQAATEVEQQLPLLRDDDVESFVDRIGPRLVQVMPSELEHREFRYSFKVINVREINAFALPGGPMYVNRGMIQAAAVEGEIAGVMAHERSHVILRHGTAGATKQQPFTMAPWPARLREPLLAATSGTWSRRAPSLVWERTFFAIVASTRSAISLVCSQPPHRAAAGSSASWKRACSRPLSHVGSAASPLRPSFVRASRSGSRRWRAPHPPRLDAQPRPRPVPPPWRRAPSQRCPVAALAPVGLFRARRDGGRGLHALPLPVA